MIHLKRLVAGAAIIAAFFGMLEACEWLGRWVFPALWLAVLAYFLGLAVVTPHRPENS